jgi:diadenylate cyclase
MTGAQIADLVISIVLCVLFYVYIFLTFRKWEVRIVLGAELVLIPVFYFSGITLACWLTLGALVVTACMLGFTNIGSIRPHIANPLTMETKEANLKADKDYARDKLNHTITQTVKWLSDSKTGALITFQRGDDLSTYCQSGTIINCPVTAEIIETIFYEGTRLHDGAIVIKNNTIVAAAVFYPSTTKVLVGKFGARHRAALGISEKTDSVTIVVSEETGRISVAYGGELTQIKYDDFEKVFPTYMIDATSTTSIIPGLGVKEQPK